MGTYDRFCQSCGMPMDKDPGHGGTNRDGTKTHKYCSLCYENGEFRDNFTLADEMIEFVKGKLKEMGLGGAVLKGVVPFIPGDIVKAASTAGLARLAGRWTRRVFPPGG